MNRIERYIDLLLDLPVWIGLPIFLVSIAIPMFIVIMAFISLVIIFAPWFLLLPVVIWAACVINWWIKNR